MTRARAVGINHVALEVGSVDEAIEFYGQVFEVTLRGRAPGMAFIDLGDQFIALAEHSDRQPDAERHFGLVVDDKEAARRALQEAGVNVAPAGKLRFRDPWGNSVEVVDYRDVQFTKAPEVLRGMDVELAKHEGALAELREKGLV
ncbi:MAG TPA: VOC family protein [Gaiellaceae bacterium]|nr:VOC family protein [Gaiellaceae bacterium]